MPKLNWKSVIRICTKKQLYVYKQDIVINLFKENSACVSKNTEDKKKMIAQFAQKKEVEKRFSRRLAAIKDGYEQIKAPDEWNPTVNIDPTAPNISDFYLLEFVIINMYVCWECEKEDRKGINTIKINSNSAKKNKTKKQMTQVLTVVSNERMARTGVWNAHKLYG